MNQYTWKQKNRLLLIGSFIFLCLIYQLSIKKTMTAREQLMSTEVSAAEKQSVAQELAALKKRGGYLDLILDKRNRRKTAGEVEAEQISLMALANGINVEEIQNERKYPTNIGHVIYQTYVFNGSFVNLVKFLNAIEETGSMLLVYAAFRKEKVRSETKLLMEIITVNIEQNKTG